MTDATNAPSEATTIMTPADLAERARNLREDAGLNQRDLADKVGYSTSTISKVENFHDGDGMVGARITIIEALTDETVEGPFYK